MDIVIGLLIAAALIWLFLKDNNRRGVRTVKAFVYLQALENGKSKAEANEEALALGKDVPKRLIHETMLHLQQNYNGRAKGLMKKADAHGFKG